MTDDHPEPIRAVVLEWSASADVYSGRPAPQWPLDDAAVARLMTIWESLPAAGDHEETPAPPDLGYRGCSVYGSGGRYWNAFSGLVRSNDGQRRDPQRTFERVVLATAPPAFLPPWVTELQ